MYEEPMIFEVGDQVMIVKRDSVYYPEDFKVMIGMVCEIKKVNSNGDRCVIGGIVEEITGHEWTVPSTILELVKGCSEPPDIPIEVLI